MQSPRIILRSLRIPITVNDEVIAATVIHPRIRLADVQVARGRDARSLMVGAVRAMGLDQLRDELGQILLGSAKEEILVGPEDGWGEPVGPSLAVVAGALDVAALGHFRAMHPFGGGAQDE
jgi:hypothetical protein